MSTNLNKVYWPTYFSFFSDKEQNGDEIIFLGDMRLTLEKIVEARNGREFPRWPNQKNNPSVKGAIPFEFHENSHGSLSKKEQDIVTKVVDRFNKDLQGCL